MMRELFLLLFAAILILAQPPATGSLKIRVSDQSGATVPNALLTVTHRTTRDSLTGVTDASGDRLFHALPAGEYLVQGEAEGFGLSALQTARIEPGNVTTVDVRLEVARVATHVQVTAAGTAQTIDEQSKALDLITISDINKRLEYSVAETIRTVPGIRVQQLGGPGSFVRILARGMRPSDTSILVDGFRFRDVGSPQGDASAFAGDLLVGSASRVEVLRGSGSSLYGTNATGGVVNIISDQGGGKIRGEVGAEGGGLSLARGFVRLSGGALSDRIRYSGSVNHLNVMKGNDGDDRARNSVVQGFVHGQLSGRTVIQGRLLASDSFAQLNDTPFEVTAALPADDSIVQAEAYRNFIPAPNDPDSRRAAGYFSGLAALSHAFTPQAIARLSFQHVSTRRDARDGPAGTRFEPEFNNSNRFDGDIDTFEARIDGITRMHLLTAGYEFEREHFDNLSTDENPVATDRVDARLQITQRSHTAFVQDQIRLFDNRLQVSLSGRMQQFALEQPVFSGENAPYQGIPLPTPPRAWTGDASLSYLAPGTGTKLRAHAGNSYRAPALFERFGASFFFGSFSAYGDPNLAPERIVAFDAGLDQYLANSRVRLSGTYFYTRLQETIAFDFTGLITPEIDPYGRFGGYRSTRGGLARGVELSVEARPARATTVQAAYTYTNADERQSVFRGGTLRSVRVSDHMWTAMATQRVTRNLDLTFDLFAATDYLYGFGDRAFAFEGPVKADIAVAYTFNLSDRRAVQAFTRIENVLNRTYYEDGFPTPRAWAVAGLKLLF